MDPETIEAKLEEIRGWELEAEGPFPYPDCRFLSQGTEETATDLITDLDLWMSKIAGYASRGRRLMKLPAIALRQMRDAISLTFLEEHPQYRKLALWLNPENTPELTEDLDNLERMRLTLCEVIDEMLHGRA